MPDNKTVTPVVYNSFKSWRNENEEQFHAIEDEHGEVRWVFLRELQTSIALKRLGRDRLNSTFKMIIDKKRRPLGVRNLVLAASVFPDRKIVRKFMSDSPALAANLADQVTDMAGMDWNYDDYIPPNDMPALVESVRSEKVKDGAYVVGCYMEPIDTVFVLRGASEAEFARYQSSLEDDPIIAMYNLVIDCCLVPEHDRLSELLEDYAGLVVPLANAANEASGSRIKAERGK